MQLASHLAALRDRAARRTQAARQADDVAFFVGLAIAIPIGLLLWAAIIWLIVRLVN